MKHKKQDSLEVEILGAKIKVSIEAEFDISEDNLGDINDCIDRCLASLQEQGSATITSKKIVGTPKGSR